MSLWTAGKDLKKIKKDFYSELTSEDISDKGCEYAQKVFKEYCTDMGNYHDLYVQTDILFCFQPLPVNGFIRYDYLSDFN